MISSDGIRGYNEVTHGKKRTYYQITADGRASLKEKLLEWQQTKIVVDQFLQGGDK